MKYSADDEQSLMTELWDPQIANDPEAFVLMAYPWGQENTPLHDKKEPRTWQRDDLQEITDHIQVQIKGLETGIVPQPFQKTTASGRGVGKSALVAWLSDWMMSTCLGSTTIIAANTEAQLRSRTFAEIAKWTTLLINSHWFDVTGLKLTPATWFEKLLKDQEKIDTAYYYCQGQTWSEENPDAFAGAHNDYGFQLLFDEASGIPQTIWDVCQGFFTEQTIRRIWNAYSNPRRNSGAFFDTFHENRQFWRNRQLDSRTVKEIDTSVFERMIEQHGIDSDVVRVEVLGQFPRQGDRQFISNDLVRDAQKREVMEDHGAALIMGVDIARYGNDKTVIRFRQGRDARSIHSVMLSKRDNMYVANEIAKLIDLVKPDAVFIDAGNGTGVIDRLREMGYKEVEEVWFGSSSDDPEWFNKRTQMYAELRNWLPGAAIDEDPNLFRDLTTPEYHHHGKGEDAIMLESKESLKGRGLPSPDNGDALALTFARRVARRDRPRSRHNNRSMQARDVDYNLFED